mmetsp:Transcript_52495/g.98420  ORF Transcript_52495/g.98420 Transcript_52495/m.98420 type:complete len:213 (+) Transcript_52495:208-846(+)
MLPPCVECLMSKASAEPAALVASALMPIVVKLRQGPSTTGGWQKMSGLPAGSAEAWNSGSTHHPCSVSPKSKFPSAPTALMPLPFSITSPRQCAWTGGCGGGSGGNSSQELPSGAPGSSGRWQGVAHSPTARLLGVSMQYSTTPTDSASSVPGAWLGLASASAVSELSSKRTSCGSRLSGMGSDCVCRSSSRDSQAATSMKVFFTRLSYQVW